MEQTHSKTQYQGSHGQRVCYANYCRKRTRPCMSCEKRAKIFAPFDALSGLGQSLREKEQTLVPAVTLSEDAAEELDQQIRHLQGLLQEKKAVKVSVTYFEPIREADQLGIYRERTGCVGLLDLKRRILTVVDTEICLDQLKTLAIL